MGWPFMAGSWQNTATLDFSAQSYIPNETMMSSSHNAALEDMRSRHHHRRSRDHHYAHRSATGNEKGTSVSVPSVTSVKVMHSPASEDNFVGAGTFSVSADSTPASSDVEH